MAEEVQGQILGQRQTIQMSPQQLQAVKLISCPVLAFENEIQREIEENPVLEEGAPMEIDADSVSTSGENDDFDGYDDSSDLPDGEKFDFSSMKEDMEYAGDDDYYNAGGGMAEEGSGGYEITYSGGTSFIEYLNEQLGTFEIDDRMRKLCKYIIGNLNDWGYLMRSVALLVNDINTQTDVETNETEMYEALSMVQSLDPAGVGARSLNECIRLQLERMDITEDVDNAIAIVEECFDEFAQKHYDRVCSILRIDKEQLKRAHDLIVGLNPKPGSTFSEQSDVHPGDAITPDFHYDSESRELQLNNRDVPSLKINQTYRRMYEDYVGNKINRTGKMREQMQYLKNNIDRAKMFIAAVEQRNNTLLSVMGAIIELQREFFECGDESQLRPLTMKRIAERVGCDISTVSRVADSKYIQTDFGIYPLRMFFTEGLSTDDGDEVSNREVMRIMRECIEAEDKRHPLSDERLCSILNDKGYIVARRTIAKYREGMGIPVSRLRKSL